jgi:hypothetical protein
MKYALNIKKGTTIIHPTAGRFEGGVAKLIEEKEANQLKHIINMIIFDRVEGIDLNTSKVEDNP